MQIAPQFQQFVDGELARSAGLLDQIVGGTLEQLRQPREGMLSPQERPHYFALIDLLRNRHGLLRDGFVKTLNELVSADLLEQHSQGQSDSLGDFAGTLTLMDEGRVEADIEISRAAQLIDATGEWELRELQSFTSALRGQNHVTPESNPFKPLFYAKALWDGACLVTSAPIQRGLFLRLASGVASGLLKKAWAAASSRIEAMGFTPSIYRTVVLKPSAAIGRSPKGYEEAQFSGQHSDAPSLVGKPTTLGQVREQLTSHPGTERRHTDINDFPTLPRLGFNPSAGFKLALDQLEVMLRQLPTTAATPAAAQSDLAAPRLRDHLAALKATTHDAIDQQIIELMGRFFDVVLSDTQVHSACRPLLAKLQPSALQVALHDPSMMQDHVHAVWLFMDELSSAFALYGQSTDYRCAALLALGKELVQEIAFGDGHDASVYQGALSKLRGHQQLQREAELLVAKGNVDELRLAEKRDHLQRKISKQLVDQMVPLRVRPGIRRFVTGDWARVLAHSILRHGEQSETTSAYMRAVDDLIWSLNPPDHPKSRQRLLTLLPTLLHRIKVGMSLIDLPAAEQQAVMDELVLAHTEALRPGKKGAGVAAGGVAASVVATPEQIGQLLRDEPSEGEPISQSFADSLIELVSMDTVPADLIHTHPPGDDSNFNSIVDNLRPGNNVRMFLRGRWTRAQLLWCSAQNSYFLFSGESPGRTHSVTQAALERLSGENLLLPLEEHSLSQRALQTVTDELTWP